MCVQDGEVPPEEKGRVYKLSYILTCQFHVQSDFILVV